MIVQQLINGLTIGSIYAMVALGYTLAYGILGLINFAHGDVYMVGAFIAYFCVSVLKLNIIISFFISLIFSGILGALIEFTAFRSIRNGSRSSQLISAIGVSIILQNTIMLTMGSDTKPFPKVMDTTAYEFSNITISSTQILIMIVALIFMIMLYFLIYKTRIGIAMRSTAQDSAMTSLMGINVNKVISITFSIGAVLGAAAGILVGIYYNSVVFNMGSSMGLKAFVAAVLGGIGNIPGTMLGGIVLGLAESLGATLISAKYKDAFSFIILILVLLFKPTGLFGKKEIEKV
ncbi:branched-chain amino acid ABC transporter permease [Sedimentibacter sp.]|uniref:branched-chain amino acid ABC transporter permease n=2 Tax=Sedimentibacter sp. TaxID=1960295 RepID=UPI0028AB91BA|nr:branched-chain amino acid ABC transporter permease [Sedimentibacter sp.]